MPVDGTWLGTDPTYIDMETRDVRHLTEEWFRVLLVLVASYFNYLNAVSLLSDCLV